MITIDGSYGEGGGQILRTAIALAGITGKKTQVYNIRAHRDPPGLKHQHLTALLAAGDLCSASIEGAEIGSQSVRFTPERITPGGYTIDIGTAGSITLLLQTLIPVAASADEKVIVRVTGGTNVRWSPTIEYFSEVFCYFLKQMGIDTSVDIERYGFYPKGGGKITLEISPWTQKKKINFTSQGEKNMIKALSVATSHLKNANVAERQIKGFRRVLPCKKDISYVDSYSIGSSITGVVYFDRVRMGGSSLGEKGKRAEVVGNEAAQTLTKEIHSGAALDRYMGDQIIPYIGLTGGDITVSTVTNHLKTNIWVTEKFLPVAFTVEENTVRAVRE